ncbi:MAG: GNAT family N-acetyltransferase [Terriglobales bacterium]
MASDTEILADGRTFTLTAPIPREHLSTTMWDWFQAYWRLMVNDPMPQTRNGIAALIESNVAKGGKSYFARDDNKQPVGAVWGRASEDNIHIAHFVFAPHQLRREAKLAITKAALRQYFAAGARKLVWGVYPENRSCLTFLELLGAHVEGTLRQETRRDGQLMDVVLLGLFPEELR